MYLVGLGGQTKILMMHGYKKWLPECSGGHVYNYRSVGTVHNCDYRVGIWSLFEQAMTGTESLDVNEFWTMMSHGRCNKTRWR